MIKHELLGTGFEFGLVFGQEALDQVMREEGIFDPAPRLELDVYGLAAVRAVRDTGRILEVVVFQEGRDLPVEQWNASLAAAAALIWGDAKAMLGLDDSTMSQFIYHVMIDLQGDVG
jgi:hypothetical protein